MEKQKALELAEQLSKLGLHATVELDPRDAATEARVKAFAARDMLSNDLTDLIELFNGWGLLADHPLHDLVLRGGVRLEVS